MSSAPTPADVKDLLLHIRRLLGKSKPELQTEWKEVDCSEFESVAKADLLAALLLRLFRDTSDTNSVQSQPFSSRSPVASATNTPAPVKSFKEAVTSPARVPASSFDCNTFGKRLTEAQLSLKEHKQKIRELDRKAETLDRQAKELNLIVYDVPETAGKDSQDAAALDSLYIKCMPDCDDVDWTMQRLGKYCHDQKRPRPVCMVLHTKNDKHTFLEHAKHLKEVGVRYDDDLTRLQQSERQDLSADFNILKTQGHKPFHRGSSLKFCHANKTCTCKRNGANTAPVAQA